MKPDYSGVSGCRSFSRLSKSCINWNVASCCFIISNENIFLYSNCEVSSPLDWMCYWMVGQFTKFGMVSIWESCGHTGQKMLSTNIPLKSFLIPEIVLDLSLKRTSCSVLLKIGLHKYGCISSFSYFISLILLCSFCSVSRYSRAASCTLSFTSFLKLFMHVDLICSSFMCSFNVLKLSAPSSQKSPGLGFNFWAEYISWTSSLDLFSIYTGRTLLYGLHVLCGRELFQILNGDILVGFLKV